MLQTVTAKLKIVVSDSQKQILLDTMKAYSNACNMVSEYVFENHDLKRYRIHEEPDELKIAEFMHVARLFGENRRLTGKVTPLYLSELLDDIADKEYAPALNQLLLRSMAKAVYSEKNVGHFGLASKYYCHFTSPIRR